MEGDYSEPGDPSRATPHAASENGPQSGGSTPDDQGPVPAEEGRGCPSPSRHRTPAHRARHRRRSPRRPTAPHREPTSSPSTFREPGLLPGKVLCLLPHEGRSRGTPRPQEPSPAPYTAPRPQASPRLEGNPSRLTNIRPRGSPRQHPEPRTYRRQPVGRAPRCAGGHPRRTCGKGRAICRQGR